MNTIKTQPQPTKTVKTNPSAHLIGKKLTSSDAAVKVNYRKGKTNVVACHEIEVTECNVTGRRLTCVFKDAAGAVVMTRKVYKEWFDAMEDQFSK
jgi:hypothetical protein